MSSEVTPSGYSIFDFLTRIIPGAIMLSPLILAAWAAPSININTAAALLFIASVSLVMGELIETLRLSIFPMPIAFREILYYHGRSDVLRWYEQKSLSILNKLPNRISERITTYGRTTIFDETDKKFPDVYEAHFSGLSFESTSPYYLYMTLLDYMEPRLSQSTRRQQIVRIFAANLFIAIVGGSLIAFPVILYFYFNLDQISSGNASIVIGAILFMLFVPFLLELAYFFTNSSREFVENLLIEYYLDQEVENP